MGKAGRRHVVRIMISDLPGANDQAYDSLMNLKENKRPYAGGYPRTEKDLHYSNGGKKSLATRR